MADTHDKHHDYHLVNPSPWPVVGAIGAFVLAVGAVNYFISHKDGDGQLAYLLPGFAIVLFTMFMWWRDVIKEAHGGDHTPVVQLHMRYGMLLFIASEVMFFVAWFWGYFDAALFPGTVHDLPNTSETIGMVTRHDLVGGVWPPKPSDNFQHTFSPWGLPLVNTLVLLLSGTTVTAAHHGLLESNRRLLIWGLVATIALGILFTSLQAYEYAHAGFNFAGHIYGSTFFMATGFHGFHVLVGTLFLIVCLFRALAGHFTPKQHFGFEAAAWYWHFVDVVWLFLFACIYVWGGGGSAVAGH